MKNRPRKKTSTSPKGTRADKALKELEKAIEAYKKNGGSFSHIRRQFNQLYILQGQCRDDARKCLDDNELDKAISLAEEAKEIDQMIRKHKPYIDG